MANEFIKRAGEITEYNHENIEMLTKCMFDPIYFIRNFVKVQHPTRGNVPFDLYEYQEELITACQENRWVIALLARQSGKTITISMYLLWYAMFNKDATILIASKNNAHAIEIMDRIRHAYEELPKWLKAGVKYYNRHSIGFENGTTIRSEATTEKTGRGLSITKLYLDELAFIKPSIQMALWRSLAPTLSTGGSGIISSTPNGDTELYATLWRGANTQTNNFVPVFIPWNRHPERGEAYLKEMRGQLGEVGLRQEILCEFISSDALLIDSLKMAHFTPVEPLREDMGFKIWKEFTHSTKYLVGVDPATGNGSDFTVIQVFEVPSLEQVAELRSNDTHAPLIYAKIKWLLKQLTKKHPGHANSEVIWTFERNGVGEALVALIQNDEGEGVYLDDAELWSEKPGRLGIYTTNRTKLLACMQLKNLVEKISGGIKINSATLQFELKNYVSKGNTYEAKSGVTDDTIAATLVIMKLLNHLATYDDSAKQVLYEYVTLENRDSEDDEEFDDGAPMPIGHI